MRSYEYRHLVTFHDTNALGNVYFTNHVEWQGRCRELFLFDHTPDVLEALKKNELHLVTREVSCSYHREVFAGDLLAVRMHLKRHTATRMWLEFDYVRITAHGEEHVAIGQQVIGCLARTSASVDPVPVELPHSLVAAASLYAPETPSWGVAEATR